LAVSPLPAHRLAFVDALRGLVIVIMTLDHVRDFFHAGAMAFSPEDLARTTPVLFFTRWITHFCAPVFVFLAGAGAWLQLQRSGWSRPRLSRFLVTRGLFLIVVELTVMRLAMNFSVDSSYPFLLLILWALGVSMIVLAALIHLPLPLVALASGLILLLHNMADGIRAEQLGGFAWAWNMLHQQGVFFVAGKPVLVAYPALPWIAVMAAGYCFGPVLLKDHGSRRRTMIVSGVLLIAAFIVLRGINGYGDPSPWSAQGSAAMTVVSFLRATKYPPSLMFVLMTMGPALLVMAWLDSAFAPSASADKLRLRPNHPLVVIGRVPMFYYVLHFWMAHLLAAMAAAFRYGSASLAFLFSPLPSMGGSRPLFPPDYGYPLWVSYAMWITVVLLMYPLCRWYAAFKARRSDWWLGYL
jgi:uncharacterized membrane protein